MAPSVLLRAWGPGFGLPSLDPFTLSVEVYLSMASCEFTIAETTEGGLPPTGNLPALQDGPHVVTGVTNIHNHMRRKGFDLDSHLTPQQRAEVSAYITMIEDKLYDALLQSRFSDPKNYFDSTSPHLSTSIGFPSRYWMPSQMRRCAGMRTSQYAHSVRVPHRDMWAAPTRADEEHAQTDRQTETFFIARECFAALAAKLGDQPYIFGRRPSSLDAVLLAHLLHHLAHPTPSSPNPLLQTLLTVNFPALVDYANRHRAHYLPEGFLSHHMPQSQTHAAHDSWISRMLPSAASTSPSMWLAAVPPVSEWGTLASLLAVRQWNYLRHDKELHAQLSKWGTVVGAIGVFVGYIVYHGIIEIRFSEPEEDEDEKKARMRQLVAAAAGANVGERLDGAEGPGDPSNEAEDPTGEEDEDIELDDE